MIRILRITPAGDHRLTLHFSDGQSGEWDAAALIARETVLTRPLADAGYFARAFLDAGALCWPNGLELSPLGLHADMAGAGVLRREAA